MVVGADVLRGNVDAEIGLRRLRLSSLLPGHALLSENRNLFDAITTKVVSISQSDIQSL